MQLQNISNFGATIHLFIRNDDGTLTIQEDREFLPYYYEKTIGDEYDAISLFGEKLKKIYCIKPGEVKKQRTVNSYEADIIYTKRYIIDKISSIEKSLTRIIFLDIEVQCTELPRPKEDQKANDPVSVIRFYDNYTKKYYSWRLDKWESEYKMLEDFCKTVKEISPDIWASWNVDFDYYYLFYRIGENFPELISPIGQTQWERGFRYPAGISIVDMQGLYAKLTLHKKDAYNLMAVGEDELGYDFEDDFDFEDIEISDKKNSKDVEKMVKLNDKLKLFDYFDEIRVLSKCLWVDLPSEMRNYKWQSNNSRIIDMMALSIAKRLNVILPSKKSENEKGDVEGAYRRTESTGLFKNKAKVDISGDYPSQIIGFCLSPENLVAEPSNDTITVEITTRENQNYKATYHYKQNSNAILPTLTKEILDLKNELKAKLKQTEKSDPEYEKLEVAYDSRKALANSAFGVLGMPFFRLYSPEVTDTITFLARDLLHYIEKKTSEAGYPVVYLDTDSIFHEGVEDITDRLNQWTIDWAMNNYNNDKVDLIFDFEGYFSSLFIQAMCRYRGRLETKKGQKIETKGIQMKRRSSGIWVKDFQEKLYDFILNEAEKEKILKWIIEQLENMKIADLISISIPCKFNKARELYEKKEIYFEAIDETQKLLPDFKKEIGERFYYIYTNNSRVLALDKKQTSHIQKDNINWNQMFECNVFNLLVPIFKGLKWETDLLDLAEKYKIILSSTYRNKLLENLPNFEELKQYYSSREVKKRRKLANFT